jgi:hypothetical protein
VSAGTLWGSQQDAIGELKSATTLGEFYWRLTEENGGGQRRKPQTWACQRPIGQKPAHFFAQASLMSTFRIQIGHRHGK